MTKKPSSEGLHRNALSYFGGLIATGATVLLVFGIIGEQTLVQPSPYVGIITYLIFPSILTFGLLLVLYGMRRESVRRRKEGARQQPYPRLDLNDPRHRKRFGYALVSGSVLLIIFAWVGYRGYQFTGSVTFCGKVCHTVMEPEYTAYTHSPHARVPCVDCHVGEGASWYVQSKLSGARQVFATAFETYDRPIPTPIAHLRPARETCERCHWPKKFFGASLVQLPHYRYDEQNTAEQISLLLRTGGGDPRNGLASGIHWHMVIDNRVVFAAEDPRRQRIPWAAVERPDGSRKVYRDETSELSDEQMDRLDQRVFDCIECHNRPSHAFAPPEGGVDGALAGGEVAADLPWIKKVLVDALVGEYSTKQEAHREMRDAVTSFYADNYPDVARSRTEEIDEAVAVANGIYDRSVFPEMNVDWQTYPNNVGHRSWPGCFRCHDGRHVADDGTRLSTDCTLCHTMPQRGPRVPLGDVMPANDLDWHPWQMPAESVDVEGHRNLLCHECHAAGFRPRRACASCHP